MSQDNPASAPTGWSRIPVLLFDAIKTWGGEIIADLQAWWALEMHWRIIRLLLVAIAAGIVALFINDPWRAVSTATYRVWVATPTKTDFVNNCNKQDEADGGACAYDRVMAVERDGDSVEFRNYDSQSFIMRLFVKSASAQIQNKFEQAREAKQEVMFLASGVRVTLFSLFPNVLTEPEHYSSGRYVWLKLWSWVPMTLIATLLWLGRGAWWWMARGVWIVFRTVVLVFTPAVAVAPKAPADGGNRIDRAKAWLTGLLPR